MGNIDGFDAAIIITGVCITAASPTLVVALPLALVGAGLHYARRSKGIAEWGDRITNNAPRLNNVMPYLLPGPKEAESTDIVLRQNKPLQVEITNRRPSKPDDGRNIPWSQRITQPMEIATATATKNNNAIAAKKTTADTMADVLAIMPRNIRYDHPKLPDAPTPMSVLIGYDPLGKRWVWADFGLQGDTIHAFIAGQTRAGKDSEIRLWFTQLTSNNSPENIQFIIIDAKGEWITPALKDSRHMYIPPVGGFNLKIEKGSTGKRQLRDLANEDIENALIDTIEILQERADEFQRAGATNLQAYERKTGKKLPLLFVVVTDIGTNLDGILEELVKFLVLKGGSLGVRAIISMQTASNENTSWRGQMGLAMSGYQGQSSADAPNLGIPVRAMKYRPSELPSVDVPENRGLFVVRKGIDQYVVRSAYLPDEVFEQYCEVGLPKKSIATKNELLTSLLFDTPMQKKEMPTGNTNNRAIIVPKRILSREQAIHAAELAAQGITASSITKVLGFTSGPRYAEILPIVEAIVKTVKTKQALKGKHL